MKIKFIFLGVAVICALGLGLSFWLPMEAEGQVGSSHNYENQAQEEHPGDEQEDDHAGHGHEVRQERDAVHDEDDDLSDENEHGEEVVRLSDNELNEFGIELAIAAVGSLNQYIELPGEIVLNADGMAHVVPRVSGIVREVRKTVGDRVESGEIMAVLESRELADSKAAFLSATAREKLAQAKFVREERLWQKMVSSEQEYLNAQQALAEALIAKNSAEQQLHALGFSDPELKELPKHPDATYTRFEIRAPFAGTIIEKHLTLGENVNTETDVFTIADLSTVWVDINVYQKDLVQVQKGQTVVVEIGHGIPPFSEKIAWVGPLVGEATRTAKARVVAPNPNGNLRPGIFVTAQVAVGSTAAGIIIPKSALQTFEERTVLFVRTEKGFEPQPIEIGRQNATQVEVISGLKAGQTYVSLGAFTLKAQLSKGAFGDGHNH